MSALPASLALDAPRTAEIVVLDERRVVPTVDAAYDKATRLLLEAQARPSIVNMAAAVDAWRAWETAFLGKSIT